MSNRPDGDICTPQELALANTTFLHCVTRGETIALTSLVGISILSAIAVLLVYLIIIVNVSRESRKARDANDVSKRQLIQHPMDIYMLSLLTANLIHAIGGLMNIKWINDGISNTGNFCTIQGVVNQVGPVAVALNTITIALVTFIAVWWRKGVPTHKSEKFHLFVAYTVVAFLWTFVFMCVTVPALAYRTSPNPYFAPTPVWCTISKHYEFARLFAKYIWFWLAFLVSILLYIPLALWSKGYITISNKIWWRFRIHKKKTFRDEQRRKRLFLAGIAYPLTNAILISPLSIVRWLELAGSANITSIASIAVGAVFGLSGLFDVLLLVFLRPGLLFFDKNNHCECCARESVRRSLDSDQLGRVDDDPEPEAMMQEKSSESVA